MKKINISNSTDAIDKSEINELINVAMKDLRREEEEAKRGQEMEKNLEQRLAMLREGKDQYFTKTVNTKFTAVNLPLHSSYHVDKEEDEDRVSFAFSFYFPAFISYKVFSLLKQCCKIN